MRAAARALPGRCVVRQLSAAAAPCRVVLSGIQPTGVPHLGNYLGALRNWAALQRGGDKGEVLYMVADLHALTTAPDPDELRSGVLTTLASLLACGVDPARSVVFRQSDVRQHAELAWVLNCLTPMAWLDRMTQFKQKAGDEKGGGRAKANLGLYSYPVLMAADILLYRATAVPVGEDQMQHLELARDVATAFNKRYGGGNGGGGNGGGDGAAVPLFSAPAAAPTAEGCGGAQARVMSLRDGTRKMSKSDPAAASRIDLTDGADAIARKIRKPVWPYIVALRP